MIWQYHYMRSKFSRVNGAVLDLVGAGYAQTLQMWFLASNLKLCLKHSQRHVYHSVSSTAFRWKQWSKSECISPCNTLLPQPTPLSSSNNAVAGPSWLPQLPNTNPSPSSQTSAPSYGPLITYPNDVHTPSTYYPAILSIHIQSLWSFNDC